MTEQLDLEDWLRENPTNNNETQKEVSGITLKDSKNNGLSTKNTSLGITPDHPKTNINDIKIQQHLCNCGGYITPFGTIGGYNECE